MMMMMMRRRRKLWAWLFLIFNSSCCCGSFISQNYKVGQNNTINANSMCAMTRKEAALKNAKFLLHLPFIKPTIRVIQDGTLSSHREQNPIPTENEIKIVKIQVLHEMWAP